MTTMKPGGAAGAAVAGVVLGGSSVARAHRSAEAQFPRG